MIDKKNGIDKPALAQDAFDKLSKMDFKTVLDIGSGTGVHAKAFKQQGRDVTTVSLQAPADHLGDYNDIPFYDRFDCIWASHVLEHQPNVGVFLEKCYADLKHGGILAITVPPRKDGIVGGHLTLWNAGLLLYNLILSGFDCSEASVRTNGYNVSVIVRKKHAIHGKLVMDNGDIETIAHLFPMKVKQNFNGDIGQLNW